jgi:hypothetical protein
MQVMPDTYSDLRARYGLGDDPFDPHNNILAGTAYLKEMYDRYGAPGFLAAYNAGPNRLDRYLNNGTPLPEETVNYVAAIAPQLGTGTAMTGPLAVYASGQSRFARRPSGAGCDLDAAYDPTRPCAPAAVPAAQSAVAYAPSACDPDAAYDPSRRCLPAPAAQAAPPPSRLADMPPRRPFQERMAQPVSFTAANPPGRWAIQVGAFANLSTAQAAADRARAALPDLLATASVELPATAPLGTQVAFRARLSGLPATVAIDACARLGARGMACMTVPPS